MIIFASINDRAHHQGTVYTCCVTLLGRENNIDVLTPTQELVYGHKSFSNVQRFMKYTPVDDQEYTKAYIELLNQRRAKRWFDALDVEQEMTICCFCRQGNFCHRKILFRLLQKVRPDIQAKLY